MSDYLTISTDKGYSRVDFSGLKRGENFPLKIKLNKLPRKLEKQESPGVKIRGGVADFLELMEVAQGLLITQPSYNETSPIEQYISDIREERIILNYNL